MGGFKGVLVFIGILVIGALIGTFLGNFMSIVFPTGAMHEIFSAEISAGLHPSRLDLRVLEVTFGFLLRFNIMTILGIILSSLLYKALAK